MTAPNASQQPPAPPPAADQRDGWDELDEADREELRAWAKHDKK